MNSYTEDDEEIIPTPGVEEEATLCFARVANPTLTSTKSFAHCPSVGNSNNSNNNNSRHRCDSGLRTCRVSGNQHCSSRRSASNMSPSSFSVFSSSQAGLFLIVFTLIIGPDYGLLLIASGQNYGVNYGQYGQGQYYEYEYNSPGHPDNYVPLPPILPRNQNRDGVNGAETCYDHRGVARKCTPEFVNAAFSLPVEATNVCGLHQPQVYCLQVGVRGASKSCHFCNSKDPKYDHSPNLMTDYEGQGNWTWWQSETMQHDVQYPNSVNLTLHLGKFIFFSLS